MSNRRTFIKQIGGVAGAIAVSEIFSPAFAGEFKSMSKRIMNLPPPDAARDEDFWGWVKECYTVSPNIINLNNGMVSPQPKVVQDAMIKYYQIANEGPAHYVKIVDEGRESLRMKMADFAGCDKEEIAFNRNSTEGLNTFILGIDLKPGDEILMAEQDYPHMKDAFKQREKRNGIKINWLDLALPLETEEDIVNIYKKAFTPNTKVVLVTHMINWTGQIMPVRAIAKAAHEKGIEVICDSAHTFAHIDFKIPELECDYWGTSLHKWMCAPFGTGMMWVKKDKIKNIWPLLADAEPLSSDIRKFENLGTRCIPLEMAITHALEFHLIIGAKRMEERLRYLKDYWVKQVMHLPKVKINTSLKPEFSCGLANFSIEGMKPEDISKTLIDKYKIESVAMSVGNVKGVRITPHLYITTRDLDRLVTAIHDMAKS